MLKKIEHHNKIKAEILTREGAHVVAKTPLIITSKNGDGTRIDIKTAGMHGSISRDGAGNVDLVAEMAKHPDALWIRVKAIEADSPNDNGDYFSREETIKAHKSFEGVPVFTNHENNKVENAKGKVVKAEWDDREGAVYCTMFIDRAANGPLCRAIEEGYVTDVSMGTQVDYSTCSVCEKKAYTADDYCDHVRTMKGRSVEGSRVFEKNYGLKFIEISVVTDGACKDCTIREILDPEEYLHKVAVAVNLMNRAIKTGGMTKDGGQAEIQKLNQAMDLLEDVSRTMLDQRQFIDLEFCNKVVEVLADLQHVNDELVDQGYGRIGDPSAMQQQQMGIPPLPENSGSGTQEQPSQGPKPFLSGPSNMGVGTVTEPATASSGGNTRFSAKIKDLHERVTKIYEEAKLSRSGGVSVDNEKAKQTIAKLAKVWENPSVKNYKMEVSEGDYKVVFGTDEIIGLKGGQKVAALKIANLDADVKEALANDAGKYARDLVDALKSTFANGFNKMEKEAGYAPTNTKEQQEMTMEAQLQSQKLPLHPRENEIRESTTEDQLKNKRDGYDYHKRTDEARDSTTEKQLKDGGFQGYEYHKRQDKVRDETFELQLRNEKWQGNVTPAGKDGGWAEGVKDQHQQITEGQLEDWKGSDKRHLPTDRLPEKQLVDDAENWGRRIASKEDALKAKTAAFKALAKAAMATGATPDEILSVIGDFTSSRKNMDAAEAAVASLASHKDMRTTILSRAKFHGSPKTASFGEVADYMLGSMADEGMSGNVALQTLEAISEQKLASKHIEDAIKTAKTEETKPVKTASSKDLLREAMADSSCEEISVVLDKSAVKADEKNADKFAEAAFEAAVKVAEKSGLKITEKVHVAKRADGKIEVAMFGLRAEAGDFGGKKAPPFGSKKEDGEDEDKDKNPDEKDSKNDKNPAADLTARKAARKEVVAQMGGAMPGGDMAGGAGGGMPGPGGGTTMPAAPGGADPTAGMPPVAGLGDGAGSDEGAEEGGEALPPGSICPVCGSDNVDIRHGEFGCNDCGAAGDFSVRINITEWPSVIEDTEPNEDDGMEGGIGDMAGGTGMEMPGAGAPPVGMAQAFKVTPEMVKVAGGKPIGSFCPHCGSSKVKLAMKQGCGNGKCEGCKGCYRVDTFVDTKSKSIVASVRWSDMRVAKLAAQKAKEVRLAKAAAKEQASKKAALENALKKEGLVAKFAKADLSGKAGIIAQLADKGLLKKS